MDLLNFSFWSENDEEERFAIEYQGKRCTGYKSLVAALQRALEEVPQPRKFLSFANVLTAYKKRVKSCTNFTKCIEAANHSAAALVNLLAENFTCFNDVFPYENRKNVRFLKRAQICVADFPLLQSAVNQKKVIESGHSWELQIRVFDDISTF
ncbi:putative UPF0553 protein C9orf64 [Glarea lozoyensis 74030]|uniref:Queuosine 5'-phosphate N-glycosylase/hydrolase n=1 Tax=Glarea lozoyensis (strain ATCC 74030 / MF5533) TaxID=1104152 RepID=H0EUZ2_GLAL7|nr:putative UPF0553 protein C9orf64 [Glarea lozoyensis 74030]